LQYHPKWFYRVCFGIREELLFVGKRLAIFYAMQDVESKTEPLQNVV
jgi:hypothetical protein